MSRGLLIAVGVVAALVLGLATMLVFNRLVDGDNDAPVGWGDLICLVSTPLWFLLLALVYRAFAGRKGKGS